MSMDWRRSWNCPGVSGFDSRIRWYAPLLVILMSACVTPPKIGYLEALRAQCVSSARFPKELRAGRPRKAGYSGSKIAVRSEADECAAMPGCRVYTEEQFLVFFAPERSIYYDSPRYALAPCQLDSDFEQIEVHELNDALGRFKAARDPHVRKELGTLDGEWCGLFPGVPQRASPMHISLAFRPVGENTIGFARISIAREPGKPFDENASFLDIRLVPTMRPMNGGSYVFSEISRYNSRRMWQLDLPSMLLQQNTSVWDFRLSRDCGKAHPSLHVPKGKTAKVL